jgi:protein farnesyltransferase/geranylgeranyltransferase type-1 subunit alpha
MINFPQTSPTSLRTATMADPSSELGIPPPDGPSNPTAIVSEPVPVSSDSILSPLSSFDWSDVILVPLPQSADDPFYVLYTPEYETVFGRFNFLWQQNELSDRALALCNIVIANFPKHFTAWQYKISLVEALGYDPDFELMQLDAAIAADQKSYQVWHFREWIVDRLPTFRDESEILDRVLGRDSKNVHAWNYALWWAKRWDRAKEVYALALQSIRNDCRNNSAWNARRTTGDWIGADPRSEFEEAAAILRVVGKNEAALCFLLGLWEKVPALGEKVRALAEELSAAKPQNPVALRMLLLTAEGREEIARICDALIVCDPVRKPYYTLVKEGRIKYE